MIILRIPEYIALDANNITLVFDSSNIVNISGNIFLYPPQSHPILYKNGDTSLKSYLPNHFEKKCEINKLLSKFKQFFFLDNLI